MPCYIDGELVSPFSLNGLGSTPHGHTPLALTQLLAVNVLRWCCFRSLTARRMFCERWCESLAITSPGHSTRAQPPGASLACKGPYQADLSSVWDKSVRDTHITHGIQQPEAAADHSDGSSCGASWATLLSQRSYEPCRWGNGHPIYGKKVPDRPCNALHGVTLVTDR